MITIDEANEVFNKYVVPLGYGTNCIKSKISIPIDDTIKCEYWQTDNLAFEKYIGYISITLEVPYMFIILNRDLYIKYEINLDSKELFEKGMINLLDNYNLIHHDYLVCKDIIE